MLKTWWNRLVLDTAKEGGDGGGGGPGNLLAPSGGGGGPAPKEGDGGNPPAADPNKPAGTPPASGAPAGGAAANWRSSLPKELQEDASLKKFTSVEALAGSYVNAQKLIGADKIPIPTSHTTDEEWRQVMHKLGLPEAADKYGVKFKDEAKINEEFAKTFSEKAFAAGLLPKQAQAMADWLAENKLAVEQNIDKSLTERANTAVTTLKTEWGDAYPQKLAWAQKFVMEKGGQEAVDHFGKIGVGMDPVFIKLASAAGEALFKEHKVTGGQNGSPALTPKELDAEIAKLQSSPAYMDGKHPQHKSVMAEITALFQKKFPGKS